MKIEVYSPTIRRKEMDAVLSVLVEEKIGPGEQSERLVQMAKESLQFDYSLALRSPVTALSVAISLFKSENTGDAVLISALSPRYYQNVITDLGMVPVISDVDPSSGCVTSELINSAIEKSGANVRCIVLHHTLGFIPEMYSILDINLPLIEDCSASYGAVFDGKKAGTFGTLTILGLEERDMLTAGGGAMLFAMERRNASV
jgi:dTDP-4-amino-4,6-dideoxygalactose transaminase